MSKKLLCFMLVLGLAGSAAATNYWTDANGVGDSLWSTAANWYAGGPVPSAADIILLQGPVTRFGPDAKSWPIIENAGNVALQLQIAHYYAEDAATTINSGDLTVGDLVSVGTGTAGGEGRLYMNGGTLNVGQHGLWVGGFDAQLTGGATGTMIMTGGTVNVVAGGTGPGYMVIPYAADGPAACADGHLEFLGGTINAGGLLMQVPDEFGVYGAAEGSMNMIIGAELILDGDWTIDDLGTMKLLNQYIADGLIKAYGQVSGTVIGSETFEMLLSYDMGEDKTTITAVPEPATIALLGLGGLALLRRKR